MDADGGDQVADELKSLDLKDTASVEEEVVEDEESQNLRSERVPSVSMRTMHFTNGDWYPEEKPKIAPPSDPGKRFYGRKARYVSHKPIEAKLVEKFEV